MERGLKLVITGDTKQLDQELEKARKSLDRIENEITDVQNELSRLQKVSGKNAKAQRTLNQQFKEGTISADQFEGRLELLQKAEKNTIRQTSQLRKELRGLSIASREVTTAYPKLSKQTAVLSKRKSNASAAAVEFSRALGDLPFGILGVANNIQQLAFVMGAGAALQIGIAAVTSLLVVFGDEIIDAIKGAKSYEDALLDIAKATSTFQGSARLEGTTLKELVRIANDETLSKETRQKAIERINDEYGEYLGNLDSESIKTADVKKKIDKLTQSYELQAKVKGAQSVLEEQYAKLAEKTAEVIARSTDTSRNRASRERAAIIKRQKALQALIPNLTEQAKESESAAFALSKITAELDQINERLSRSGQLAREEDILQGFIENATEDIQSDIKIFEDYFRKVLEESVAGSVTKIDGERTGRLIALKLTDKKYYKDAAVEAANVFSIFFDKNISPDDILNSTNAINLYDSAKEAIKGLTRVVSEETLEQGRLLVQAQAVAEGVAFGLSDAFSGLGDALADSIDTGNAGFTRFAQTIVSGAGDIIGALLGKAVATAILGAEQAALAFGPGSVFAAPALIAKAVGTVISAFAAIPSFAQGGIVPGGSYTGDRQLIFANSGERILTNQDQSLLDRILENNLRPQAFTGQSDIELYGALRGDVIHLTNQRAARRNKRFNG